MALRVYSPLFGGIACTYRAHHPGSGRRATGKAQDFQQSLLCVSSFDGQRSTSPIRIPRFSPARSQSGRPRPSRPHSPPSHWDQNGSQGTICSARLVCGPPALDRRSSQEKDANPYGHWRSATMKAATEHRSRGGRAFHYLLELDLLYRILGVGDPAVLPKRRSTRGARLATQAISSNHPATRRARLRSLKSGPNGRPEGGIA